VVFGALLLIVPVLLELTGIVAPSFAFHDGVMSILPRMVELPRTATVLLLTASSVGLVLVASLLVGRNVAALADAERRLHAQAWHLQQFVPREARQADGSELS
jgi:hypothetical protein